MDKDTVIESAARFGVQASRLAGGNVSAPERIGSALLGVGLLMLSRKSSVWGLPVAIVGGAAVARAVTGYCPVYDAMGDRRSETAVRLAGPRGQHIREHITINQPVDAVYSFWRELTQVGDATKGRMVVTSTDRQSHWELRTRRDGPVIAEWTADLINDVPGKVLGWRTTFDADIVSAGGVNFKPAPGGHGTEVHIHLQYAAPLGWLGTAAATVGGYPPGVVVRESLRDIKRYLELGRSVTLKA